MNLLLVILVNSSYCCYFQSLYLECNYGEGDGCSWKNDVRDTVVKQVVV